MTYREKAVEILASYLGMTEYQAKDILRAIDEECEYKPCVIGRLNAPEDLEDWDAEIGKNSVGFKISFYNDCEYGKEILNLPIIMNGRPIGVVTDVNDDEIVGCVWHKRAVLEIERAENNVPVAFEMVCG